MLSPMGLSLVSKVAPAHMRGLMMGGWFVATAIGNKLTAIGRYWRDVGPLDLLLHPGYNGTLHVRCSLAATEATQESHARRLVPSYRKRASPNICPRQTVLSLREAPLSPPSTTR